MVSGSGREDPVSKGGGRQAGMIPESGIESGFGLESGFKCYGKHFHLSIAWIAQQPLGFPDPEAVNEVEKSRV